MKMILKNMNIKTIFVLMILIVASAGFVIAASQPEGPTELTIHNSSRRSAFPTSSTTAYAGNITHITLTGQTVTQSWQGFVGNVSGTITLDDARNYTLYDWTLGDPEGEVYATYVSSIDWTTGNVLCWNWSHTEPGGDGTYLVLGELEGWDETGAPAGTQVIGAAVDDVDGVNETFTCDRCEAKSSITTTHTDFYVGGQFINGTGTDIDYPNQGGGPCPVVKLYNETSDNYFEEVILYHDGTSDGVVYTSLIQVNEGGYNNETWDFEMIVGENGHNGDIASTTYYFYVELE